MSLKTVGLDALNQAVQYNISLAEKAEQILRESGIWVVISPATRAVINFRYNPLHGNYTNKQIFSLNQATSKQIILSGEALLTTMILQKQVVCVCVE